MSELAAELGRWGLDERGMREQMYGASTARERECWHALWLLDQGWPAVRVATALERDPHTVGDWLDSFRRSDPAGLAFEQTGGPPTLDGDQQAALKVAVQAPPREAGI